ncbi:MAG TPA: alkaline phosphatase family protein [Solirubrobacteraceae bacterium]|nr:alkaline phosphatase family protein [Solirubrobacteraceae bacterium]
MPARPPAACAECGSPLAGDQRYCLSCGARQGPRPPALERILEGLSSGAGAPALVPPPPAARRSRGGLPSPLTAAVLTLAMLGFGTVTGAAASNPAGAALSALRRGPLTLLIPAPAVSTPLAVAPPAAEEAPTPEASPSGSAEESPSEESSSPSGESHKHAGKGGSKGSGPGSTAPKLPPVKHVFLIVLADQAYAQAFGPESPAPFIAHTLEHRGELLVRFYGVAHEELADEVALISGLGPTPQTAADCPTFTDIVPGQANSKGQYTGQGCIYPKAAETVGEQLAAKGLGWKVYAEGLGDVSGGATGSGAGGSSGAGAPKAIACWHPEFGAADPTSQAPQGDTFATFRDPFAYFDGVLHSPECARHDAGIEGLAGDLKSAKSTPALSYIVPDLCHDGRPTPCAPGAPSGLPAAETFLRRVVSEILASPAYHKGGLLIITTDQAPTTGEYADSSSCCMQPRFPAPAAATTPPASTAGPATTAPTTTTPTATTPTTPAGPTAPSTTTPTATTPTTTTPTTTTPTTTTPTTPAGPTAPSTTTPTATTPATTTPASTSPAINLPPAGGGQVGALLISPYVKPATFDQEPFNDFSLLRTIENLFGLPPLGYAATRGLSSLEASVFSAWSGAPANSS